ncbi:MAG TPA: hypothetical protein VF508_10195, partial [Pyrinomonadaceae bacterium]
MPADTQRARREEAVGRGMEFLRRVAHDPGHFEAYGHDLLFCLDCIASTSRDPVLREAAAVLGRERAFAWRRVHASVPEGAGARDVVRLVFGGDAAERLGVADAGLRAEIRRAAARFTAADFFRFDPAAEPPPPGLSDDCPCGALNPHGLARCEA